LVITLAHKQSNTLGVRHTNDAGVELIKHFEGLRLTPYLCSAGKLTIGYGHTAHVAWGMRITEDEAEILLKHDLLTAEAGVSRLVRVPLTDNQYAALVSFVFNLGIGRLASSTLLKRLNTKDYDGAAGQFGKWVFGGGKKLAGLITRREAERVLFVG